MSKPVPRALYLTTSGKWQNMSSTPPHYLWNLVKRLQVREFFVVYCPPPETTLFVKIKIWEGEALRCSEQALPSLSQGSAGASPSLTPVGNKRSLMRC